MFVLSATIFGLAAFMLVYRRTAMRTVGAVAALALVVGATGLPASGPAATVAAPLLVAIRGAEHSGADRVAFEFRGGLPAQTHVAYVRALVQDGSGLPIPMPGRATLEVRVQHANAHDQHGRSTAPDALTLPLRNVMRVKRAGDFEAVVSYGIAVAQRQPFRVTRLRNPDRLVVDIDHHFRVVSRPVWFMNLPQFQAGRQPGVTPVIRWVPASTPATGVMDRLFAGPTAAEFDRGLRMATSGATGFAHLSISDGVARVRLTGGCASHGSTFTIANEIDPTLRQFAGVASIKIADPLGATANPSDPSSSIPGCLEP
jgi:hypothetical protein